MWFLVGSLKKISIEAMSDSEEVFNTGNSAAYPKVP